MISILLQLYTSVVFSYSDMVQHSLQSMMNEFERIMSYENPMLDSFFLLKKPIDQFYYCNSIENCNKELQSFDTSFMEWERKIDLSQFAELDKFISMSTHLLEMENIALSKKENISFQKDKELLLNLYYLSLSKALQVEILLAISPIISSSYLSIKEKVIKNKDHKLLLHNLREYDFEWNEFIMKMTKEIHSGIGPRSNIARTVHFHWNNILKNIL